MRADSQKTMLPEECQLVVSSISLRHTSGQFTSSDKDSPDMKMNNLRVYFIVRRDDMT